MIGSLWEATAPGAVDRDPLAGSVRADVAIVGAGYTGLWTAYHLLRSRPGLEVVLIEAEHVGFGASGRNGGWATADVSINRRRTAKRHGRDAVTRMMRAMHRTVDEIGEIVDVEGIDCDYEKGGTLTLATSVAQVDRVRSWVEDDRSWGFGDEDYRWMEADEVSERVRVSECHGAYYTAHCAAIHPMKLVHGLAGAVERLGGRIFEQTRAAALNPGRVVTDRGVVRAPIIVEAIEAYAALLRPRDIIPVYSLMVATEPLPETMWDEIGLGRRETFHDGKHLVIYGQRTADGRFAFGGRGAPYHYGSSIRPAFDRHRSTHDAVEEMLRSLFPQLRNTRITHRWGGPVGMPRDLHAGVRFDESSGFGSAGGYVGVGVAASHLAGQTLAELILGEQTDRTSLPWVGHRSRRWEPEPLRWVGVNLGRMLAPAADAVEDRTGRPSRIFGGMLEWLLGHE